MITALAKTPTVVGEHLSQEQLLRLTLPGDIKSTTVSELQRDVFALLNDRVRSTARR